MWWRNSFLMATSDIRQFCEAALCSRSERVVHGVARTRWYSSRGCALHSSSHVLRSFASRNSASDLLSIFRKCSEEWPAVAEFELTVPVPCGTPDGRVFCPASSFGNRSWQVASCCSGHSFAPSVRSPFSLQASKKPPTYDQQNTKSNRITFDLFSLGAALRLACRRLLRTSRTNRCEDRP